MDNNFANVEFSKGHKVDSAALDAITGLRLTMLSFMISLALTLLLIGTSTNSFSLPASLATASPFLIFALAAISFCCGAYGFYLIVDALGWSGYIGFFFIASLLIPYLRLVALIVVFAKGMGLISSSKYRFTLWGKSKERA